MGQFSTPIPEGVNVETFTVLAYEDDRPSELVMAGTCDPNVKHLRLTRDGSRRLVEALTETLFRGGVAEVISDGPAV